MPDLDVEQQGMVAGSELGGSDTDTTTDVGFLQNLLGQRGKAIDLSLPCKHCLKTPLFRRDTKKCIISPIPVKLGLKYSYFDSK